MKTKDLKINFRYLGGNIACLSVDSIAGESIHNDINNEEAIIIFNSLVGEKENCQTVKTLLKENQELKSKISNMKESYETDAEAKFYDYLGKYNSKKPLTANDYVELNKNNEILMSYNQTLLKENQELKKQLEEITDYYCKASNIKWERAKRIIELKTQQKEFIKYLEDLIKQNETVVEVSKYGLPKNCSKLLIDFYKEILQKYKEIIGVLDENNKQ